MRLTSRIYLVAAGSASIGLTNPFDCNVFLVDCGDGYVLIDCGAGLETERIAKNIEGHGFAPGGCRAILITHAHADHSGGAAWLAGYTGARVYALRPSAGYMANANEEAIALKQAIAAGLYPQDYRYTPCPAAPLEDGETISIGDIVFHTVATPGHCSGHCAYFAKVDGVNTLFSGDCIFPGGKISLQPIWDCSVEEYARSLQTLEAMPVQALMPSHHGILLSGGHLPISAAAQVFKRLGVPPNAG